MSLDLQMEGTGGSNRKVGVQWRLWGALGRRTSLRLDLVAAFIAVNLILVAACLVTLRQNAMLRVRVASDMSLLAPRIGTEMISACGRSGT
jgi:hypothetical protein